MGGWVAGWMAGLGWLIPPFWSSIYFAPFLLGDLKYKEDRKIICFLQNILLMSPKRGSTPENVDIFISPQSIYTSISHPFYWVISITKKVGKEKEKSRKMFF